MSCIDEAIQLAVKRQIRFDNSSNSPEKTEAKKHGLSKMPDGKILDIGGEEFYHKHYKRGEIVPLNLPNDMHKMTYRNEFDGILAMHVLEHTPIPLAVLLSCHKALKKDGVLYVAVPTIENNYFMEIEVHFSVMPEMMWARLLRDAGFSVMSRTDGVFGNYLEADEYRITARKV